MQDLSHPVVERAGTFITQALIQAQAALLDPQTWLQLALVCVLWLIGWSLSKLIRRLSPPTDRFAGHLLQRSAPLLSPILMVLTMLIAVAAARAMFQLDWIARGGLLLASIFLLQRLIQVTGAGPVTGTLLRWVGMPLLALAMLGLLGPINTALESMAVQLGNLRLSVAMLLRSLIFGGLLFWLGRVSNSAGQTVIRRQQGLDVRTREVIAKLFQIGLSVMVFLLFLQVMGINLTALTVFGGAVGVGLGFGLQSIASNFISGLIILFDRSLAVGDYVETEGGQSGYVRELSMRYTTLETFEGKMILVPNEKFISAPFNNWSHKDQKQRYDVKFSLPYDSDVRNLCELIRKVVAAHPQVLSGAGIPEELQPDCEIESFGDSAVNMLAEFWIEGIDDGVNRVRADLMLLIYETLNERGISMPFPQREVRILKEEILREEMPKADLPNNPAMTPK